MKQCLERKKGIQGIKYSQEHTGKLHGRLSKEESPHPSLIKNIRKKQLFAWLTWKVSKPLVGW